MVTIRPIVPSIIGLVLLAFFSSAEADDDFEASGLVTKIEISGPNTLVCEGAAKDYTIKLTGFKGSDNMFNAEYDVVNSEPKTLAEGTIEANNPPEDPNNDFKVMATTTVQLKCIQVVGQCVIVGVPEVAISSFSSTKIKARHGSLDSNELPVMCEEPNLCNGDDGCVLGDPHFHTWANQWYGKSSQDE